MGGEEQALLHRSDYEVDIPASLVIEAVNLLLEPQSVQEALNSPDSAQWKEAMEKEYVDLMRNNTWELVELPKGKKMGICTTAQYCRSSDASSGSCNDKRLPAEIWYNFWETYAPVVTFEAVKLALHFGLVCHHVDFVTAFLNGPIDCDDIYMEIPEYFDDGSGRVCRLLRSLYGLKQAPLIWYKIWMNISGS
ncbi:Retrotransposon Tca5 Polyprotein [Phytophthora palmivora]|uniref:Retrotransposon Tca5 Polyprotein n=1 Tax=Phytophthora palmivora TaxID=4796 RepID=A0A2P4X1M9_9STRA|nr:Retrotransposon Tca5 Polyprotein [Phytophthora palmivora]